MLCEASRIIDGKAVWKKCIDMFYNYKVPLLHEWLWIVLREWHQNWRQSAAIFKGHSTRRIYAFLSVVDVWVRMKSDNTTRAVSKFHCIRAHCMARQLGLFPIPKRPKDFQDSDCWIHTFGNVFMHVGKVMCNPIKVTFLNQHNLVGYIRI